MPINKNNIGFVIRLISVLIIASLAVTGAAVPSLSNSGGGSWQYYKEITISNSGSALNDYQVLVSLTGGDFPTNAQTSGADIRFTDASGTELSYWIECRYSAACEVWDYSGRSAKIWVKVPSIPASGSATIRMYYGNPSASSANNGAGTFMFFDDFSGGISVNSNLWTTEVVNSASIAQSGGELTMMVGATQQGNSVHIKSNSNFAVPYRLRFKAKLSGYGDHFTHSYDGTTDATWSPPHVQAGQNFIMYWLDQGGDSDNAYNTANGNPWTRTYITTGTANVYSIFEILATTSAVKYVVDDTLKATHTTNIPTIALPLYFRLVTEGGAPWTPSGARQWMDYVFLAKYASSEPTLTLGAEQTTSTPTTPTPTPTTPTPIPTVTITPTPTPTLLPDLVVTNIRWDVFKATEWYMKDRVFLYITVKNQGNAAAISAFKIDTFVDNYPLKDETSSLGAGETYEKRYDLLLDKGEHTVEVWADSSNSIDESNEQNNMKRQVLSTMPITPTPITTQTIPTPTPIVTVAPTFFKNTFFTNPSKSFNTGVIKNQNVNLAPGDQNWAWGLRGYSWDKSGISWIKESGFESYYVEPDNYDVKLYGKDDSGKWAVVTLIQGWIWGETPPANWYSPPPFSVAGNTNIVIDLWVKINGGRYPWWKFWDDSMRNGIVDIWMKDESTGNILMMDLYFQGNGKNWKEDNKIYHYAANVVNVPNNQWGNVNIDVNYHIDRAIEAAKSEGMSFDKNYLKIYQVEVLHELKNAWGDLWIGSFRFTY